MYDKVLYSNEDITISSVAVLLLHKETPLHCAKFLGANESESFILFIGSKEGSLQSLEVKLSGEQLKVSMERRQSILLQPPGTSATAEVSDLFCLGSPLNYLLVVLGGHLVLLEALSLEMVCSEAHRITIDSPVRRISRREDSSNSPVHGFVVFCEDRHLRLLTIDEEQALVYGVSDGSADSDSISLVEYDVTSVTWVRSVVVVGTRSHYLVFDVDTLSLVYRMDISELGDSRYPPFARSLPEVEAPLPSFNFIPASVTMGETSVPSAPMTALDEDCILIFSVASQLYSVPIPRLATEVNLLEATPVEMGVEEGVQDLRRVFPFLLAIYGDRVQCVAQLTEGPLCPVLGEAVRFSGRVKLKQALPFPFGLLAFSPHTVEAAFWRSTEQQLESLVKSGHYTVAILFFNRFAVTEDGDQTESLIEELYKKCGDSAYDRKRYREAFEYYSLSNISPLYVLDRHFPELSMEGDAVVEVTVASRSIYEPLFFYLRQFWLQSQEHGSSFLSIEEQTKINGALFILCVHFVTDTPHPPTEDLEQPLFIPFEEVGRILLKSTPLSVLQYRSTQEISNTAAVQEKLNALLSAKEGKVQEALQECEGNAAVDTAGLIFSHFKYLGISKEQEESFLLQHLPWMMSDDVDQVLHWIIHDPNFDPPPSVVCPLLLGASGLPLFHYLDHLIHSKADTTEEYHTVHAINMIEMIIELQSYLLPLEGGDVRVRLEGESISAVGVPSIGLLGSLRETLQTFLKESDYYSVDETLVHLRITDFFFTEQALVLEKVGDHIGALTLFVYALDDVSAAEGYCVRLHREEGLTQRSAPLSGGSIGGNNSDYPLAVTELVNGGGVSESETTSLRSLDVPHVESFNKYFHLLLNVLLVSPEGKTSRQGEAFALLERHYTEMDPILTLSSLPSEIPFTNAASFLIHLFQAVEENLILTRQTRSALDGAVLEASHLHTALCQRFVCIDESRRCVKCQKLLSMDSGLIAIFPNLKMVHLRCQCDLNTDPERGVPFL